MFNIFDWYWVAEDGRVYSSKRQAIVDATDEEYVAWTGGGMRATEWPRDLDHNQTDAALQEVLTPYKMFVNLQYYTANARREKVQGDIIVNGLRFSTDPVTYSSLNSAYIYTQSNAGALFSWKLPDGGFVTLSKADTDALHEAANEFAQNCFRCEDTTLTAIEAGTITDRAGVDAAFAAISNNFTGLTSDAQKVRHGPNKKSK